MVVSPKFPVLQAPSASPSPSHPPKTPPAAPPPFIDIVLGIDGTASRKWLNPEGSNSHVYRFVQQMRCGENGGYLHGPGDLGLDVANIVNAGVQWISERVTAAAAPRASSYGGLNQSSFLSLSDVFVRLSLVGHSRGGLIAILIAKRLRNFKVCPRISGMHLHFLGLYDAVDWHLGPYADVIPGNVSSAYHALRDPTVCSRTWFGNTGTKAETPCRYTSRLFTATHSGVGGDPWKGDKPSQINEQIDILGSAQVGNWMMNMAKSEGLPMK